MTHMALDLPSLSFEQWFWLLFAAALIGMSKAGISGLGMLVVPLMAAIFGGKVSTGLILPMLVTADIFAVRYYNRHASWPHVWKLLPATAAGILAALATGYYIDDATFKMIMAWIIIAGLVLMIIQERRGLPSEISGNWLFGSAFGLLGGFSTMIGNAAGPVMSVYLLAARLPKNNYIGTGAWFFLIVNLFKIPLHVFFWKTITWHSFSLNLLAVPVILIGVWAGIKIVRRLPERGFRYLVIGMTLAAAIRLFF